MKNNKKVEASAVAPAPAPAPVECANCQLYRNEIAKLQQTNAEYQKAYKTLKMKLETIFNITQL